MPIGKSIGGTAVLVEISGTPVFVKVVPLSDVERRPENVMSTANVFKLPTYCQYGLGGPGSPGFGVWREVAAHTMSTNWVLSGDCVNFPMMYHWRVLPVPVQRPPTSVELKDLEDSVQFWEGSPAVRSRLEAGLRASANVVFFMEHIPVSLNDWLERQLVIGGEIAESAVTMVDRELKSTVLFMNSRDLLHFDAHFRNIMTDGQHLYFADFGLAISSRFELSKDEAHFFQIHRNYDKCYTTTHLANFLARSLFGAENQDSVIQEYASGKAKRPIPPAVAAVLNRYAPTAVVMNAFFRKLQAETRLAEYPSLGLERP